MNDNIDDISIDLKLNIDRLEDTFKDCMDLASRNIYLCDNTEGYLVYIKDLVDATAVQKDFIIPMMDMEFSDFQDETKVYKLPTSNINIYKDFRTIIKAVLSGNTVIILNGINYAIGCSLTQYDKRSITEPQVETVVRGSHEGFVEIVDTNISILRRKIKSSSLKFKEFSLGETTNQKVVIGYIEGISNPQILKVLIDKIISIDYDGLLANGYIQQIITDFPNSIFPQYRITERPDMVEKALLEGRFVILLDGTPGVLIAPVTLMSFFNTIDDYSSHWIAGSTLRVLRISGAIISVLLPALYIAMTTFHYYMVPFSLLIPLANSRAKVPFTPIIEGIIMGFTIEALREAAIRLPTYISASIGVVGGIILGQAVVNAGIVSNLFIIVIAITAISSYMIPTYDLEVAVRTSRAIFVLAAAALGILGIVIFASLILAHLVTLESLGQPYLQPFAPLKIRDLGDSIVRFPLMLLKKRPDEAKPKDKIRGKNNG